MCAMSRAINRIVVFNSVPDNERATMLASGSKLIDRALKAVELVGIAIHQDFEALVVFISAFYTFAHVDFVY